MRVHLSARRETRERASAVAVALAAAGHEVISRWLKGGGHQVPIADNALYSLTDVAVADCVVLFAESPWQRPALRGANDRLVEFGYALHAGKRLCVLGPRETAFCHLPEVQRFRTVKELIRALG